MEGCLDIFTLLYPFSPLCTSLWETARYRLKYCYKWAAKPKTTNHTADDKLFVRKKNIKSKLYHIAIRDWRANSVDLDEVAHYEPPHQDLHCLQIQLFASLVLKELNVRTHNDLLLLALIIVNRI